MAKHLLLFSRKFLKKSLILACTLLLGCIFLFQSIDFFLNSDTLSQNQTIIPFSSQVYLEHPQILIESDGDFGSYNFSGDGSRGDPYLIEGYNITISGALSVGIDIRNTNLFFIINSCLITTDYIGVGLHNVASGTSKIIGNRINSLSGDGGGITLGNMQNSTISDNICSNFMQGIHLNAVDGCLLSNNYFYDMNYQGINIRNSDSNTIIFNRISKAREHGIALVLSSSYNVVHHNILEGNTWSNTFEIEGTPIGSPASQGYDDGTQNIWYDSENYYGNIWSDYFGIGSYFIDGPANAIDLYPNHTTGITPFIIIILSTPIMIGLIVILSYKYYFKRKKIKNVKK